MKKRVLSLLLTLVMVLSLIPTTAWAEGGTSNWPSFRGSESNMAITSANTPVSPETTAVKWAQKLGSGDSAAGMPIIVDGYLYAVGGQKLNKLNLATGEVLKSAALDDSAALSGNVPITYGGGLIFCSLNSGKIQAFDVDSMTSKWVYNVGDSTAQGASPITYTDDGRIYTGFWVSETKDADYVCLDAATGRLIWKATVPGGFYWAGSVAVGDFIVFGTDDGASGSTGTSHLYSMAKNTNPYTVGEDVSVYTVGKDVDFAGSLDLTGLGDQRSSLVYAGSRVYFTTKGGYLCSAAVDPVTGAISDLRSVNMGAQSTCTPVVYNGYVYVGTGGGKLGGATTRSGGHFIIADADTLTVKTIVPLAGECKSAPLLSTAYASEGFLYFYCTYNAKPGGVALIKVKTADQSAQMVDLYKAAGYEEYCISSVICDADGNLYYKNDSGNLIALTTSNVWAESITVDGKVPADFDASVINCSHVVKRGTKSVTLSVTPVAGAAVTINGEAVSQKEIALSETPVQVTVTVTKGGETRSYTVTLRWESNDASLDELVYNGTTFAAKDAKDNTFYVNTTGNGPFKLKYRASDANAVIKVFAVSNVRTSKNGADLSEGATISTRQDYPDTSYSLSNVHFGGDAAAPAVVRIQVTAEDGVTVQDYLVRLYRSSTTSESTTVYVTISVAGTPVLIQQPVQAADRDNDGTVTVDDVLYAAHKLYAPNKENDYASADSQYGLYLTKLWGDESGAFGYYLNNVSCWSAADAVADGSYLTAFVYADKIGYSDAYAYFNKSAVSDTAGSAVALTLMKSGYDANWNTVTDACTGAKLAVYDKDRKLLTSGYTVKETGKGGYTVTINKAGTYYVVATTEGSTIVPAVCQLTISRTSGTNSGTTSGTGSAGSVKSSSTGDSSQMVLWVSGAALSAAAIVWLTQKKKRSAR